MYACIGMQIHSPSKVITCDVTHHDSSLGRSQQHVMQALGSQTLKLLGLERQLQK